ncbi:MAG TPA: ribosome-associated translation inhibitor RaiA [Candidatus Saccharimonadales bacterium]|jgi:putative sigma-54 modulation protein
MIATINVTGVRYTPDELTKRYVRKKIGSLDRYLSRHVRKSATIDVRLKEVNQAHGNKYECDVVMHLPEQTVTAKDTTLNMLAAVDIVEEKLRTQLKKYHDMHHDYRRGHNLLRRLKRRLHQPSVET